MEDINIDNFKKEGFNFEEIQKITKSINNFKKTGITYNHENVKSTARNEIFSNTKINV